MLASAVRREELLTSYVVNNLSTLFPGYHLSEREKPLPGSRTVDLYLKDREGNDLFVEIRASKITKGQVGELIDYYSAIVNLEPQPKNPRLVVIGEGIDDELKR